MYKLTFFVSLKPEGNRDLGRHRTVALAKSRAEQEHGGRLSWKGKVPFIYADVQSDGWRAMYKIDRE